jgi:hypothetical protein
MIQFVDYWIAFLFSFRFLTKFCVGRVEHSDLLDMLRLHSKYHLIEKYMQLSGMQVNVYHNNTQLLCTLLHILCGTA